MRWTGCSPASRTSLSRKAQRSLEGLGVTVMLKRTVVGIDDESVTVSDPDGATERIPTKTVIWAAGVTASPLAGSSASSPAPRSTAPAGSPSSPTSPSPATPR